MSTLESTPIPTVKMTPAIPGRGERRLGKAEEAQQDDQVQEQSQVRVDARRAVIEEHERHDRDHADDRRPHALANGIGAQRRPHRDLLQVLNAGRQRT